MASLTRLPIPLLLLGLAVATGVVFMTLPGIDLWVSGLFWRPDAGFFLRDWAPFRSVYEAVSARSTGAPSRFCCSASRSGRGC